MTKEELKQKLSEFEEKYILAIYTDRADFVDEITDVDKLLEVRAFDKNSEFRAYRDVVSAGFKTRSNQDDVKDIKYDGYYDQAQYLDIDTKIVVDKDNPRIKATIGGGAFTMPSDVQNRELLVVRYYYRFNDNGIARICDWRLLDFTDEEMSVNG